MFVDMSIIWENCPGNGEIIVQSGQFIGGTICRGIGNMTGNAFSFTGHGPCHLTCAVRIDNNDTSNALLCVKDEKGQFEIPLQKALEKGEIMLSDSPIRITAERNRWAEL